MKFSLHGIPWILTVAYSHESTTIVVTQNNSSIALQITLYYPFIVNLPPLPQPLATIDLFSEAFHPQ